jgi:GTP-binding protein
MNPAVFASGQALNASMKITSAEFVKSSVTQEQLPGTELPEFAFIGRSNVGKSSLINMLVQKRELAKTSGTPGKTRTFNHFLINKEWYLADLPGYGFARVSREQRNEWEATLLTYLHKRENLVYVFILVDMRLEPQKSDLEFINKSGMQGIPLAVIFTKSDKLGSNVVRQNLADYKKVLLETWEELPPMFVTSAEKGLGRDEMLNFIEEAVKDFKKV